MDDAVTHGPATEMELLELRLRIEALERDVEVATSTLVERTALLDSLVHRRWWRAAGLLDHMRRRVGVGAALVGAGPGALRIPIAGLPARLDGPGEPRWLDAVDVGRVEMPGLLADPPSRLRYDLEGAGEVRLRCFVALRPGVWASNAGGVRFRAATIAADGTLTAAVQRDVDPARLRADRRWVPMELSFTLRPGVPLTLELATSLPPTASGHFAWAVWGDPVLLAGHGSGARAAAPAASRVRRLATEAMGRVTPRSPTRGSGRPSRGHRPTISLLMPVHDPDPDLLAATLDSVRAQDTDGWDLRITDDGSTDSRVRQLLSSAAAEDPRITVRRHEQAQGIAGATNAALAQATGDYVATLDHDDLLAPGALAEVQRRLKAAPATDVLYTDNDKVGPGGVHFAASLKPGWSPDLLRACMYTLHLGVYRRSLVQEVGGWRPAFDGAQDHDLMLRLSERTARVAHVPVTAYGWRVHEGSAALGALAKPAAYDRGARAVTEHLARVGVAARAERLPEAGRYRVVHEPPGTVGVVVVLGAGLLGAGAELRGRLQAVLAGLRADADAAVEVAVVAGPEHHAVTDGLPGALRVGSAPWTDLLVAGAAALTCDAVVLLEELCLPTAPGWAAELTGPLAEHDVGAVAAVLADERGAVLQAGFAVPAQVPLPVHANVLLAREADLPPELTMVANRSAAGGVVAVRRHALAASQALSPGWDRLGLAALTAELSAAGRRVVVTPHVPWQVEGPARTAVTSVPELQRFAQAWGPRRDPFWNPRFWPDRADGVVPRAMRETGRLTDWDRL